MLVCFCSFSGYPLSPCPLVLTLSQPSTSPWSAFPPARPFSVSLSQDRSPFKIGLDSMTPINQILQRLQLVSWTFIHSHNSDCKQLLLSFNNSLAKPLLKTAFALVSCLRMPSSSDPFFFFFSFSALTNYMQACLLSSLKTYREFGLF